MSTKISSKKNILPKKFWRNKSGVNDYVQSKKKCLSKKFESKKFLSKKKIWIKIFLGANKLLGQKNFSKKFVVKNFMSDLNGRKVPTLCNHFAILYLDILDENMSKIFSLASAQICAIFNITQPY